MLFPAVHRGAGGPKNIKFSKPERDKGVQGPSIVFSGDSAGFLFRVVN